MTDGQNVVVAIGANGGEIQGIWDADDARCINNVAGTPCNVKGVLTVSGADTAVGGTVSDQGKGTGSIGIDGSGVATIAHIKLGGNNSIEPVTATSIDIIARKDSTPTNCDAIKSLTITTLGANTNVLTLTGTNLNAGLVTAGKKVLDLTITTGSLSLGGDGLGGTLKDITLSNGALAILGGTVNALKVVAKSTTNGLITVGSTLDTATTFTATEIQADGGITVGGTGGTGSSTLIVRAGAGDGDGSINIAANAFNIGGSAANATGHVEAVKVAVTGAGTIQVGGSQTGTAGYLKADIVTADGGTITVGGTAANATGYFEAKNLTTGTTATTVGANEATKGTLIVTGTATLGAALNIGASTAATISNETFSEAAIASIDTAIAHNITAYKNSRLTLGAGNGDFLNDILVNKKAGGIGWGNGANDFKAALGITQTQTLDGTGGGIGVGVAAVADKITIAGQTLTAIDAANLDDKTVFQVATGELTGVDLGTTGGTANVAATLYIANAQVGNLTLIGKVTGNTNIKEYGVAVSAGVTTLESWNGANLYFDNIFLKGTTTVVAVGGVNGSLVTTVTRDSAASVLGNRISSSMGRTINNFMASGLNNTDSTNAGTRFLSQALSGQYLAEVDGNRNAGGTIVNSNEIIGAIEGVAAAAAVAGVQGISNDLNTAFSSSYISRFSILGDTAPSAGSSAAGSKAVWVTPFYSFNSMDGAKVGNRTSEYDSSFGGVVLGVDGNITDSFRLGAAFTVGGGDTEADHRNFYKTDTDLDFWGLALYSSYTNGQFGITGDIGYTAGDYDFTQKLENPVLWAANGSQLHSDIDTNALTFGVTGEYRHVTGGGLILIPHAGLRFTSLETDGYQVKNARNENITRVESDIQNIWSFPLGLTFTTAIETATGWNIKPMVDLGAIFAAGDLDVDSKFRFDDTTRGTISTEVVDTVTFNGILGIEATNATGLSLGLDYNLKASDNLTSHSFSGMLRCEF